MNEQELQQTLATLQQYEAQIKAFSNQLGILEQVSRDYARSKATLEGIQKAKEGEELLLPIGQGTHIFAKLAEADKAIVSLGSGVARETTIENALERVGKRLEEAQQAMESYAQSLSQMQNQYAALSERVEAEMAQARANAGQAGGP